MTLRALADPTRRRIVELLTAEQLCVCHLMDLLGARQTNVSNHLRVLRDAGLVETEACGRFTYYRLRPHAFDAAGELVSGLSRAAAATAGEAGLPVTGIPHGPAGRSPRGSAPACWSWSWSARASPRSACLPGRPACSCWRTRRRPPPAWQRSF